MQHAAACRYVVLVNMNHTHEFIIMYRINVVELVNAFQCREYLLQANTQICLANLCGTLLLASISLLDFFAYRACDFLRVRVPTQVTRDDLLCAYVLNALH